MQYCTRSCVHLPWARSDEEKATVFAKHLAKTFTPNDNDTDEERERDLDLTPANVPPIKPTTPKEIQQEINRLNPKKAPGTDKITPMMIKKLPQKGDSISHLHIQRHLETQILAQTTQDS
jgi:hypothetical protein